MNELKIDRVMTDELVVNRRVTVKDPKGHQAIEMEACETGVMLTMGELDNPFTPRAAMFAMEDGRTGFGVWPIQGPQKAITVMTDGNGRSALTFGNVFGGGITIESRDLEILSRVIQRVGGIERAVKILAGAVDGVAGCVEGLVKEVKRIDNDLDSLEEELLETDEASDGNEDDNDQVELHDVDVVPNQIRDVPPANSVVDRHNQDLVRRSLGLKTDAVMAAFLGLLSRKMAIPRTSSLLTTKPQV